MKRRTTTCRRSVALLELILLLPMLIIFSNLVYHGLSVQMSMQRRITTDANHHAQMRVLLSVLRSDLRRADSVAFDEPEGQTSGLHPMFGGITSLLNIDVPAPKGPKRSTVAFELSTSEGLIRYRLTEEIPIDDGMRGKSPTPPISTQTLTRLDEAGAEQVWTLKGLRIFFDGGPPGDGKGLNVRLILDSQSLATRASRRSFETTLMAGAAR